MRIFNENEIDIGAELLKKGEVLAFPTETVFGLGCIFNNKNAYNKLVEVKRRPPDKPFTLMLSDPEEVEIYAELNKKAKKLINSFMPGQFTLIIKAKPGLPEWAINKQDGTIGLRVPDYDLVRNLIRKVGKPLLVPSANKAGEPPANTVEEVENVFENEISGVFDGFSTSKTPSTIVLIKDENIILIREGNISLAEINKVLEEA